MSKELVRLSNEIHRIGLYREISNKISSPISEILHKTLILNASLGLEDYNVENYQKKHIENSALFVKLLDEYVPDWFTVYDTPKDKPEILIINYTPDELQKDIEMYRSYGNNMLSILMRNILGSASDLAISLKKYDKEDIHSIYDIKDDVGNILAKIGMTDFLFYGFYTLFYSRKEEIEMKNNIDTE